MVGQFAICVKNDRYQASLELRKIYEIVSDVDALQHDLLRVIDESGEDYLYPIDYFIPIDVPQAVEQVFKVAQ